jgi:hypothetical protein
LGPENPKAIPALEIEKEVDSFLQVRAELAELLIHDERMATKGTDVLNGDRSPHHVVE